MYETKQGEKCLKVFSLNHEGQFITNCNEPNKLKGKKFRV